MRNAVNLALEVRHEIRATAYVAQKLVLYYANRFKCAGRAVDSNRRIPLVSKWDFLAFSAKQGFFAFKAKRNATLPDITHCLFLPVNPMRVDIGLHIGKRATLWHGEQKKAHAADKKAPKTER